MRRIKSLIRNAYPMIIVDPWSALTVCVIAVGDRGGVNLQLVWLVGRMMEKDTARTLRRNPLTVDRTFSDHQVSIAPIFPVSSNLRKNIPCKPPMDSSIALTEEGSGILRSMQTCVTPASRYAASFPLSLRKSPRA